MKHLNATFIASILAATCVGARFDRINFSQDIDTRAIQDAGQAILVVPNSTGVVIRSESTIRLYTSDED